MYLPDKAGRRRATAIFLLPSLVGIIGFCLLPIAGSLFFSLMDYDLLRPMESMTFVGLKNFVRVLTGREFRGVLAHTFTYLGLYLPLIMAASVGEALILNKSFRGHGLFRTVCYTPVITSWVAAAVVWQWVLSGKYGLLNQMLAAVGIQGPAWLSSATWAMPGIVLASVWKDTGYYALMVLAALKSIDPGYYEAADLDGASGARKFFSITLPLISPTLFLLIVINIIYGLQVFDSVLIMTDGGPGGATTVFLERIYKYAFVQYKMGMASTYACILFVVLLLFTAVLCMKKSYPGNLWSETAAMLGYSELGKNLQVPSTVRVMESISPYGCMLQVFFLLFCYSLTLSFVILVGNLYKGKTKGMIFGLLYSVFVFLLDPKVLAAILHKEKYEMYQVNVLICWISPLNQAVYGKHNLGYDPLLPKISHSYMFFLGILVLLAVFAINRMKKYTFEFLGEKT